MLPSLGEKMLCVHFSLCHGVSASNGILLPGSMSEEGHRIRIWFCMMDLLFIMLIISMDFIVPLIPMPLKMFSFTREDLSQNSEVVFQV